MTAVRFLYTSQPGKGFEEFTSPDQQLKNWLIDNLRVPSSPSNRSLSKGLGVTLQDDQVLCTYLSLELDDNKRRFIRSHSALFTEAEYNRVAKEFDRSILAQLEKTDEEILENDLLKPLVIPDNPQNGLGPEELKILVSYQGWDLKQVLASLIAGKPFNITIRGSQEESIGMAVTLLKIAALGDLPVPQISTFEPNGRVRAWYPSQVSSLSQARVDVQFQARGAPGREAIDKAERLGRAVENLDPYGIRAAMISGRNHAEVGRKESSGKETARTVGEERKPDASPPRNQESGIYENNKEFEAHLNSRKEKLDDIEDCLHQRKQKVAAREENVAQKEEDVVKGEDELSHNKSRLEEWQHIDEIVSELEKIEPRKGVSDVRRQLLENFFDRTRRLNHETLQDLQDRVPQLVPNLKGIADRYKSNNKLSSAITEIEKKLESNAKSRK